jgi:hypothetical protein
MDQDLRREIVNVLARNETKATYTALSEIVGGLPRGVMSGLNPTRNNRWITGENGLPTGYPGDYLDDQFRLIPCNIRNGDELIEFLQHVRQQQRISAEHGTLLAYLEQQDD